MMANLTSFRRILQLDVLNKSCRLVSSYNTILQSARPSSSIAYLKNCSNSSVTSAPNYSILKEVTQKTTVNSIQSRASSSGADHVRLWVLERILSAALPVIIPAAFIFENPLFDGLLAVATVMHTHWGLEAIIVDYARPIVVGHVFPKVVLFALNVLSVLTLAGLLALIYNGPGIARSVKNLWAITSKDPHKGH